YSSSLPRSSFRFSFSSTPPATSHIYTLSLHDALPISILCFGRAPDFGRPARERRFLLFAFFGRSRRRQEHRFPNSPPFPLEFFRDRKSTRLNSSHVAISYAVFCLKKKKKQ